MDVVVIDIETGKEIPKSRWDRFKAKVREKKELVTDWCVEHSDTLMTVIPIVVAGTVGTVKMLYRKSVVDRKENLMKYSVYDRSENHHWFLKRELTNREWAEVAERRAKGERLGDILEKMKVLR